MQTYVVTGGAGFLGSHICERLLADGADVISVDNLITGSVSNIHHLLSNPHFKFIEFDVIEKLPTFSEEINGIFHFASPASPNHKSPKSYIAYPIETLLANSLGTHNTLSLAKEKNARFVYASSSEVYGDPEISPQKEDYFGNVNPNGPRSVYDEGKRFGEAVTQAFNRKFGTDTRIIRIFNTYGDRMQKDDGRVISNFINQALQGKDLTVYGDGSQTRSFCYVDDLVDGIIKIMYNDNIAGEVINLGNPTELTFLEAANKIIELTRANVSIQFEELPIDDPTRRKPDISHAQHLIGFNPIVSFEEGVLKTIEYFKLA